jgi:hypothetical protein
MSEKLICKCCGAEARWCDSKPDEDGHKHDCDHIHCDSCRMHYSLEGPHPAGIESFEQAKEIMLLAYNRIATAPSYSCQFGHAHRTLEAKTACELKKRDGLTAEERSAKRRAESKPRFLEAYRLWNSGTKKSEVAEKYGVSRSRADQIIKKGYRLASKDGIADKRP